MERAYKFRIYPNKKQEELIQKTFGCSRYVYNEFLSRKSELYKESKESLSFYQCSKDLTMLKKKIEWLQEVDKWALQNSLKDLDNAYNNFFKKRAKYPNFKSKKNRHKSYRTTNTNNSIEFLGNFIKLPKLKKVKCKGYKEISGRILNATISQVPSGKYYISLCCTDVEIEKFEKTGNSVGLDLGIKDFAISSNGDKYDNPKYLEKSLDKLKKLQREMSRKTSGGSNWNKSRIKVARLQEKISNQRKDYLHKVSTEIIKDNDIICIETLRVSNMLKNRKLSKSISSASWGKFVCQLEYKSKWHDRDLVKINSFYASSQICSCCGYKNQEVKNLKVRKWECPNCNTTHDRDINASKNILNEGLKLLA